jgi:hypothetical protein
VVGANDDAGLFKWIQVAGLDVLLERLCLKDHRWQEKFVSQFLAPLLAQVSRDNDEQTTATFGPLLRKDDSGLDGFAETYLVGEDRPLGKRRTEGKKSCVNLVRVECDVSPDGRAWKCRTLPRR